MILRQGTTCSIHTHTTHTQWKAAPKSKLMDSKLRCVFVEGEPREAGGAEESQPAPTETQEKVRHACTCTCTCDTCMCGV